MLRRNFIKTMAAGLLGVVGLKTLEAKPVQKEFTVSKWVHVAEVHHKDGTREVYVDGVQVSREKRWSGIILTEEQVRAEYQFEIDCLK